MSRHKYVHGYSEIERERLMDQANTLADLLHHDIKYPGGVAILEAGCGTGAQTVILTKNSPNSQFTSIDISEESIKSAETRVKEAGRNNVKFKVADVFNLPFPDKSYDHIFVCFLLEHLQDPVKALLSLKTKLKNGGTITVIEGDHRSAYFHPDSKDAWKTIQCLIDLQSEKGGNSLIGRQLFLLLTKAKFKNIQVSPRMVYADSSKPEYVEGFTKKTFIAMVEGIREQAINSGMITSEQWEKGIQDLYKATKAEGTFCYTFFKAVAYK